MTGRLIKDEIERLDNLFEKKRILKEKYAFTTKRLKALAKLCQQNNKVPTVENGFILLLQGGKGLRQAMAQQKIVCGKLVEKFDDFEALREDVFYFVSRYNYNKLQENLYQAIAFCRKHIFKQKKVFYFPKIVMMDTRLIEQAFCGTEFEKRQTVKNFFEIMHVGMKRSAVARKKLEIKEFESQKNE